jgi:hypothetical protein
MNTEETWPVDQPLPDVPMDRQIVELNKALRAKRERIDELEVELAYSKSIIKLHEESWEMINGLFKTKPTRYEEKSTLDPNPRPAPSGNQPAEGAD